MAYLIAVARGCHHRNSDRSFCKAAAILKLIDAQGQYRGEFCRQHAGAELAKLDATEKAARKGGDRKA